MLQSVRDALSHKRLKVRDVEQLARDICSDVVAVDELFRYLTAHEQRQSWHALWVCEKLAKMGCEHVLQRADVICQQLMACKHWGMVRIYLNIVMLLPIDEIDFKVFNYCMDNMLAPKVPPAVQSMCIKIAYKFCANEPELSRELLLVLQSADRYSYPPATQAAIRNCLKMANAKM